MSTATHVLTASKPRARLPADFSPGTLLDGRYEVVELLGQGSSGMTYLCRDTAKQRYVAVKCLSLRRQVHLSALQAQRLH